MPFAEQIRSCPLVHGSAMAERHLHELRWKLPQAEKAAELTALLDGRSPALDLVTGIFGASPFLSRLILSAPDELIRLLQAEPGAYLAESAARLDAELPSRIGQHFSASHLATIRLARHGGTLLFLPPEDVAEKRYVQLKYRFDVEEPRQRFRTLLLRVLTAFADSQPAEACVGWPEYNATPTRELPRSTKGSSSWPTGSLAWPTLTARCCSPSSSKCWFAAKFGESSKTCPP
ncbi:MAG: hypothetical protein HC850_04015 [Rhodomicrobium sp.]|nr:hypothetical protein [Rhodomicrobium sp.]